MEAGFKESAAKQDQRIGRVGKQYRPQALLHGKQPVRPPDGPLGRAEGAQNADAAALLLRHVREDEQQDDQYQQHGCCAEKDGQCALILAHGAQLVPLTEVALEVQRFLLGKVPVGAGVILRVGGVELEDGLAVAVRTVHILTLRVPVGLLGGVTLFGVGVDRRDELLPRNKHAGLRTVFKEPHAGVFVQNGQNLDVRLRHRGDDAVFRDHVRICGKMQNIARPDGIVGGVAVGIDKVRAEEHIVPRIAVVRHQQDAALAGEQLL